MIATKRYGNDWHTDELPTQWIFHEFKPVGQGPIRWRKMSIKILLPLPKASPPSQQAVELEIPDELLDCKYALRPWLSTSHMLTYTVSFTFHVRRLIETRVPNTVHIQLIHTARSGAVTLVQSKRKHASDVLGWRPC